MKLKVLIFLSLLSSHAFAINTSGYEPISGLKAWSTKIDVYLQSGQQHQCSGGHKTRFQAEVVKEHHVSFLLAAFMANKIVSLAYSCNSSSYPIITGVRIG